MIQTFLWRERGGHSAVILAQFSQQPWGNGEKITPSQCLDLSGVPEGRTHDHGGVIKLLIVVVDLCYAYHTCTRGRDGTDKDVRITGEQNTVCVCVCAQL